MKKLQRELRKAVADEKYEVAAELRDRIRNLENETQTTT
jgi:protein-arginine kinase activator protein McsA